jgi:3-oxoacyl-[acyl-carrier-protein] synthase-3
MAQNGVIKALGVSYPGDRRTNDYFRTRFPEVVSNSEKKSLGKIWAPAAVSEGTKHFDAAAVPYMEDPFRGTVRRCVLAEGESIASFGAKAARDALAAAGLRADQVELMIVTSLISDTLGVGDAARLSGVLGLKGAAWNLESACSGTAVALQTANAMIKSGQYRNVLIVASCSYSREADPSDSLAWFVGDGAAAILVGEGRPGEGVLATKTIHTVETCNAFFYQLEGTDKPRVRMRWNPELAKVIRETSITYLRTCCDAALEAAGSKVSEIDFFVFNTPTAWYARFCADALGVPFDRTIDTYPLYGNMGPVLLPTNLYRAAKEGKIRSGDLVLTYTVGSTSTASASVIRWGDVALGPDPEAVK